MYRVLYVDDEPALLEIGRLFLEGQGKFSVDTLPSATQALGRLKTVQYDTIVSDYQMPGMDGLTFLKTLRAGNDATPFIIFTGKGREEVVIEALNSGADFYLQKGGDPTAQFTELAHKILHAVERRQADLALKKSERDYRHLVQYATEGIFVIQDGVIRMANPMAVRMSGYAEKEMVGMPFTEFIHPDDQEMILGQYRRRLAGEKVPSRYSFRVLRKDRAVRWIELNVVSIVWNDRPATLNFITDTTDRMRAEDALKESEERYRQFFRTTRDAVFITTPSGRWVDFNDAAMELFGFPDRDSVYNAPVASLYEDPAARAGFLAFTEQHGYVREYPVRLRKRDGTAFDALITMVPQKNPDGTVRAFIGTIRDITGLKTTERALRESEERYRLFFATTLDSVFITSPDGRFLDFNEALMKTLRAATRDQVLATSLGSIYEHPAERPGFLATVNREGLVREQPFRFRRLDGSVFDALLTIVAQKNPDGTVRAYVGTVRDLSGTRERYCPPTGTVPARN